MAKKKIDIDKYASGLFQRTEDYADKVRQHYATAVNELLKISANRKISPDTAFSFADNIKLSAEANKVLRWLYSAVYNEIKGGVIAEWEYANLSCDALIESIFGKGLKEDNHFARWFSRNQDAMNAFFSRKSAYGGMNLSQKVWKYTGDLKTEMELALSLSLGQGESASTVSRKVRQYLQEPDKLFRRIKIGVDEEGNPLYGLSKAAKAYHPGRGMYRSSYKNAMRLTRTETNMAYRAADHERWQQLPFVVGIEVKLSNNHNCVGVKKGHFYDICDELAGKYPKDFKFVGWHPQCRCYVTPVLAKDDEFVKAQKAILAGEDVQNYNSDNEVKEMPKQMEKWIEKNNERIDAAVTLPYWIRDNKSLIKLNPYEKIYGHKAGAIIKIDNKLTQKVRNALKNNVATLTEEQKQNAKEIADKVGASLDEPMRFEIVDSGNVNPKYGQSGKYDINCMLSVVAGEARARGINVRAAGVILPKGKKKHITYELGENMSMAWINPKTKKNPIIKSYQINNKFKEALTKISELTKENGRYYLGFDGDVNHAVNIYRTNGKFYLYDQQINGSYDLLMLLKENNATSFEVLRLDNLLIDKTNMDQWIEAL